MSGSTVVKSDTGASANANIANSANTEHGQLARLADLALATTQKHETPTTNRQSMGPAEMVKSYSGEPVTAKVATSNTPGYVPEAANQNDAESLAKRWHWFHS